MSDYRKPVRVLQRQFRIIYVVCLVTVATSCLITSIVTAQAPLRPRRLPPVDSMEAMPTSTATPSSLPMQTPPSTDFIGGPSWTAQPVSYGFPSWESNAFVDQSPLAFSQSAGMPSLANTSLAHTIDDFSPTPLPPMSEYHDPLAAQWVYDSKQYVKTQSPWVEWGREFYGGGITPRGRDWFGPMNMVRPQFYVYGDQRTGIIGGRNAAGRTDNLGTILNLDLDLRLTDSERFHAFVGPLARGGDVTGVRLENGELNYQQVFNPNLVTGFFEGDLGAMWGGFHNKSSPAEMPFTAGLIPLLFQNGIWMEDAVTGAAFAIPAKHSRLLNWSNFDTTFFAIVDQLNSNAFGNDQHAAQAFGNAWFIEAYDGYIEAGYAYLRDRNQSERSYHNMTISYTRRYFDRISNSLRVIINAGQDLAKDDRTADGGIFLWENSLITAAPLTVVPYLNMFYGWGRPQSVARAGGSGGILRNTGINFDTDGINGFATLDPNGFDTTGGSLGVDLLGRDLDRQLLLEVSYLTEHGDLNPQVKGDQYGVGARYQFPISNARLLRFDVMHGWRGELDNVYGTRMEYRWKF
ncbi:hypothetical protein Pla100_38620 [Neorhodopirellula pilleata]|uniref:Uncharacterized protein n=2 Tax=Neorhodopirellula pilleata TaxID=2714738 RepID=A0A5C6A2X0_9BACT|nr:hypothetical protein Pla100_38620 [Neorhodopirellula pilleata]